MKKEMKKWRKMKKWKKRDPSLLSVIGGITKSIKSCQISVKESEDTSSILETSIHSLMCDPTFKFKRTRMTRESVSDKSFVKTLKKTWGILRLDTPRHQEELLFFFPSGVTYSWRFPMCSLARTLTERNPKTLTRSEATRHHPTTNIDWIRQDTLVITLRMISVCQEHTFPNSRATITSISSLTWTTSPWEFRRALLSTATSDSIAVVHPC